MEQEGTTMTTGGIRLVCGPMIRMVHMDVVATIHTGLMRVPMEMVRREAMATEDMVCQEAMVM